MINCQIFLRGRGSGLFFILHFIYTVNEVSTPMRGHNSYGGGI